MLWSWLLFAPNAIPLLGADCAFCFPSDKAPAICARHAEIEKQSLPQFERVLRFKKETQARVDALHEIARLTDAHANAPSIAVAEALAARLGDADPAVSAEAARLLGEGQHLATARKRLGDVLAEADQTIQKHERRLARNGRAAVTLLARKKAYPHTASPKALGDFFRDVGKDLEGLRAYRASDDRVQARINAAVLASLPALASACLVANAESQEQCYSHFHSVLFWSGEHAPAAVDSLLLLGTKRAASLAVRALEEYQEELAANETAAQLQRDFEFICREAPPGMKLPPVEGLVARGVVPWGEKVHASLARFAAAKGLGAFPEWDKETYLADARKWLETHGSNLPVTTHSSRIRRPLLRLRGSDSSSGREVASERPCAMRRHHRFR